MHTACDTIRISVATAEDRKAIYGFRHSIYAAELHQHHENAQQELTDALDSFNTYICASIAGEMAGFICITPPGHNTYSIDKYFDRSELPVVFDNTLYEIRLLSVLKLFRNTRVSALLMYAAFRWIADSGGTRVVAIGRAEILDLYLKTGMESLHRTAKSGAVTYELLSATIPALHDRVSGRRYRQLLASLEKNCDWQLPFAFRKPDACFHGGAFFEAIGEKFDSLEKSREIINADVLDAWFPPSPKVVDTLQEYLPWLLRTSPPVSCKGMVQTISEIRGVPSQCIVPGAGSSSLIFLAFRQWLNAGSRVLILDPTYGEYAYVCDKVINCTVDRFALPKENGFKVNVEELENRFKQNYDLIVLVNPNNPTGRYIPHDQLAAVLGKVPDKTVVWIDEAYLEYMDRGESLERFAVTSNNIVVCKSLSKVYALSGARAAYLCGPERIIEKLRLITPPWAVSLPAQIAAVMALQDPEYYAQRYAETRLFRESLEKDLSGIADIGVISGNANFILCHIKAHGMTVSDVIEKCRKEGVFLRDVSNMGTALGHDCFRIAVKSDPDNRRIINTLQAVTMRPYGTGRSAESDSQGMNTESIWNRQNLTS